jgi:RNA polymerase sigma-70 factor (ECF subfamily)
MPLESLRPGADSLSPVSAQFTTTHWSVVLKASEGQSNEAQAALSQLCANYWYPLYAYVRRRGYRPEDAQDLTQSFFLRLLEKNYVQHADRQRGKFRTFLLAGLSRFLADEWDRGQRIKRGGGQTPLSFDAMEAENRYRLEPAEPVDAAKLFERRWALLLVERTVAQLELEFSERGEAELFKGLSPFLLGDQGETTFAAAATGLGLTPAAMKMAVSRLRRRCRELLRAEVLQTVADPQAAEEEYQALLAALRS